MNNDFKDYKVSVNEIGDVTIQPIDGKYEYCLIFIHGLNQEPIHSLRYFLSSPLRQATQKFKIVMPRAPVRKVTSRNNNEMISWFDIKTYENSFDRPFDEAFSSQEIEDSFQRLKPIIEQECKLLNNDYKKIFISGFSQGCGMSIYTGYRLEQDVGGIIGIAGYYFTITPYNKERVIPILTIHGLNDDIRPWEQAQKSYEKFLGKEQVQLVQNMAHEMNTEQTRQLFANFLIQQTKL